MNFMYIEDAQAVQNELNVERKELKNYEGKFWYSYGEPVAMLLLFSNCRNKT